MNFTGDAKGKRSVGPWRFEPLRHDPEAHVISNVGLFAFCRRDKFCRCRKCKPPLAKGAQTR